MLITAGKKVCAAETLLTLILGKAYILSEQSLRVYAAYRVSSRDSGKTAVDAALGEVMVTCEKIWWLLTNGQKWLKPEYRSAGIMVNLCLPPLMASYCTTLVLMHCSA